MNREEATKRLIKAIKEKRKELQLTEKDTEKYQWLAELIRQSNWRKTGEKPDTPNPKPMPSSAKKSVPPPANRKIDFKA